MLRHVFCIRVLKISLPCSLALRPSLWPLTPNACANKNIIFYFDHIIIYIFIYLFIHLFIYIILFGLEYRCEQEDI